MYSDAPLQSPGCLLLVWSAIGYQDSSESLKVGATILSNGLLCGMAYIWMHLCNDFILLSHCFLMLAFPAVLFLRHSAVHAGAWRTCPEVLSLFTRSIVNQSSVGQQPHLMTKESVNGMPCCSHTYDHPFLKLLSSMNPPQVLPLLPYFVLGNFICQVYFGHYDYQLSLTYLPLPWKIRGMFQ